MDYRQLKAFIAVFEERNITAASLRMNLTQPALSTTIKALEESLDTQLFMRQARGVEVTEAARALYPRARRMVAEADGLVRQFRHNKGRIPLEFGIERDIEDCDIEAFLKRAYQAIPDQFLSLQEGCVGDARLGVEENRCEDEHFVPLWEEAYILALPLNHDLLNRNILTVEDLAHMPWITCPTHPSHQRLFPFYADGGKSPMAEAGTLPLALNLVAAGIGVAFAPESLVNKKTSIAVREVSGVRLMRRVGLCYAVQALEKRVAECLQEFVEKLVEDATLARLK